MSRFSRTVASAFREDMCREYPCAFTPDGIQKGYAHLLQYVLFSYGREEQVLAYRQLARFAGQERQAASRNFEAKRFIEEFEAETKIRLNVTEPNFSQSRARTMRPQLPTHVIARLLEELRTPSSERHQPVSFVEGVSRASARKVREAGMQRQEYVYAQLEPGRLNSEIVRYFRDLPTNAFSRFSEGIDEAVRLAASENLTDGQRYALLSNLHELSDWVKPLLLQHSNTERLFEDGQGLQNLPARYRRLVLRGSIEADLQSAHLRICGYDWKVVPLVALLESGRSPWAYFCETVGVALTETSKAVLKSAVYAVLYGAGKRRIREVLAPLGSEAARRFLHDAIVLALLKERDRRIERIEYDGGIETLSGWHTYQGVNPHKLLHRRAEDIETYLIASCYEAATQYSKYFQILSHEHDGFSFILRDKARTERVKRLLQEAVFARGERIGIRVCLEFS